MRSTRCPSVVTDGLLPVLSVRRIPSGRCRGRRRDVDRDRGPHHRGSLLYLAVTNWRASRRGEQVSEQVRVPKRSLRKTYLMATLTNLANPKVILFYLAFVPQFLATGTGSLTERVVRVGGTFRRRLDRFCAAVFAGLAVRLAADIH
ncbi:LysE family translocator [Kribbella sp. NPDC056345]|uniref:LysE family translocator n=1 Tax=Kribbella sp. NPDC056345 TaxID=3345789 RepID=UPI0035E22F9E